MGNFCYFNQSRCNRDKDIENLESSRYLFKTRKASGMPTSSRQRRKSMKEGAAIALLLGVLVLLGFGCQQVGQKPQQPEAGMPDAGAQDSGVPVGWREYRSTNLGITFNIPESWDVAEVGSEIWLSDSPLPEPLPPDLLELPAVVSVTTEDPQVTLSRLQRLQDEPVRDEIVRVANTNVRKFTFSSRPDFQTRVLYLISRESGYVEVGAPLNVDNTELKGILESLVEKVAR